MMVVSRLSWWKRYMMRGLALMRGPTSAISRSSAAIATPVHLSSTSIAFSHSMTIVTGESGEGAVFRGARDFVDFWAMAGADIGSGGRQASPVLARCWAPWPDLLEVPSGIHDILSMRDGAICPIAKETRWLNGMTRARLA